MDAYQDRLFLCTTDSSADVVDTDPLTFTNVAQSLPQVAGTAATALRANASTASLEVRTDDVTVEINGTNDLQLRDLGITNAKIADATVANAKLVHPDVTVNTGRGLLGGQLINLGTGATLTPDFTVVPDLAATNTFAAANTFQGVVHVTSTAAATSQSTGAVVVDGGLGVVGDLYVSNTFNMSDLRLKENVTPIPNALEVVNQMDGCTFTWKDCEINQVAGRVGQATVGVIAQNMLEAGAKHCVAQNTENGMMAVDYGKIAPYLIESTKEMAKMVVDLKRRCEDLEVALEEIRSSKRSKTATEDVEA